MNGIDEETRPSRADAKARAYRDAGDEMNPPDRRVGSEACIYTPRCVRPRTVNKVDKRRSDELHKK
jgi:hypothetical protein